MKIKKNLNQSKHVNGKKPSKKGKFGKNKKNNKKKEFNKNPKKTKFEKTIESEESDLNDVEDDLMLEQSDSDDDITGIAKKSNLQKTKESKKQIPVDSDDEEDDGTNSLSHKETLDRLKEKDPEFYKFLEQNDRELLAFNDNDDLDDDEDQVDQNEIEDENDDGEDKPEEDDRITLARVNEWRQILQQSDSSKANLLSAIKSLIKAFRRTVNQTTETYDDNTQNIRNSIEMLNPAIFNAIINSTLLDLLPALMKFLRLQNLKANKTMVEDRKENASDNDEAKEEESEDIVNSKIISKFNQSNFFDPRRSRNWKRIQSSIKVYLTDVLKMMDSLSNEARSSFERHVLELTPFFNVFPHLVKRLVKRSMTEWCSGDDDRNRVLAFLILHRMIRVLQSNDHLTTGERQTLINQILRRLYLSYIGCAKNTNQASIVQISFMKNSLVELYNLDEQLAYQHAFIFIRQMAINLRNSFILKQQNALKTVYNWQYVHSILLWTHLITSAHNRYNSLDPLIMPLVTVIVGTIRLLPTSKFLPLRFILIRALIKLSAETEKYIPVLGHFLEIYNHFDPNQNVKAEAKGVKKGDKKKNKKGNKLGKVDDTAEDDIQPDNDVGLVQTNKNKLPKSQQKKLLNFDVILKVTKEQTSEIEFVQKVIEKFYELALYYLSTQSADIGFPELVAIFLHHSRKFVKKIRFAKERTMMKQLLDKVAENSIFIANKRRNVNFPISDRVKITAWERELKESNSGTPLMRFYKQLKEFKKKQPEKPQPQQKKKKQKKQSSTQDDAATKENVLDFDENAENSALKVANNELMKNRKHRTFNMESDIVEGVKPPCKPSIAEKKKNSEKLTQEIEDDGEDMDEDQEIEFDDEEGSEDEDDEADEDDEEGYDDIDDDDEEIDNFEDVELTAEQMAVIQKKIAKEEKLLRKFRPKEDNDDSDDGPAEINGDKPEEEEKRKRNRRYSNIKKKLKARKLNPNLNFEGAFDMSSDDDD